MNTSDSMMKRSGRVFGNAISMVGRLDVARRRKRIDVPYEAS
jgi:hypothetical protein